MVAIQDTRIANTEDKEKESNGTDRGATERITEANSVSRHRQGNRVTARATEHTGSAREQYTEIAARQRATAGGKWGWAGGGSGGVTVVVCWLLNVPATY